MEHSQLDFPATGAASDFSSFISAKSILCTVLSYIAVTALMIIITVILPFIIRALLQGTQNLENNLDHAALQALLPTVPCEFCDPEVDSILSCGWQEG